ncbi:MAG TPA: nicotinate-nucleotide--dimethylbenzimidazole phosphoribosyltransferase, partial [Chloroflexota bacterium]|nr:nicotinate-nucleotide--dimethylbenzimidazole phosphoribosyltransferase [Chloroflexota bacterium]
MDATETRTESEILALVGRIQPPDSAAAAEARARQAQLTKPAGSLGRLEELAVAIAGLTGSVRPRWQSRLSVVFAADHGVAA